MLRLGIRVGVAIVTFATGIAIFWPLQAIHRLETALVDRFYDISDHDLRPISVNFDAATDANEIYRVLIHDQIKSNNEIKLVVLRSETTSFVMFKDDSLKQDRKNPEAFRKEVQAAMPEAQSQTLDNYLFRNQTQEQLKVWNLGIDFVLVAKSDLPHGAADFWDVFYKKFPHSPGIISFSNVGFNHQHDQAFAYVAVGCGLLCGEGEFVLLKKVDGKWQIQKEQVLWVS